LCRWGGRTGRWWGPRRRVGGWSIHGRRHHCGTKSCCRVPKRKRKIWLLHSGGRPWVTTVGDHLLGRIVGGSASRRSSLRGSVCDSIVGLGITGFVSFSNMRLVTMEITIQIRLSPGFIFVRTITKKPVVCRATSVASIEPKRIVADLVSCWIKWKLFIATLNTDRIFNGTTVSTHPDWTICLGVFWSVCSAGDTKVDALLLAWFDSLSENRVFLRIAEPAWDPALPWLAAESWPLSAMATRDEAFVLAPPACSA
jgi:hypothetical protein